MVSSPPAPSGMLLNSHYLSSLVSALFSSSCSTSAPLAKDPGHLATTTDTLSPLADNQSPESAVDVSRGSGWVNLSNHRRRWIRRKSTTTITMRYTITTTTPSRKLKMQMGQMTVRHFVRNYLPRPITIVKCGLTTKPPLRSILERSPPCRAGGGKQVEIRGDKEVSCNVTWEVMTRATVSGS